MEVYQCGVVFRRAGSRLHDTMVHYQQQVRALLAVPIDITKPN